MTCLMASTGFFSLKIFLGLVGRGDRDNVPVSNLSLFSPSPHLCFGSSPEIFNKMLKSCVVPVGRWGNTERKANQGLEFCRVLCPAPLCLFVDTRNSV